jgi:hypothetical protein
LGTGSRAPGRSRSEKIVNNINHLQGSTNGELILKSEMNSRGDTLDIFSGGGARALRFQQQSSINIL